MSKKLKTMFDDLDEKREKLDKMSETELVEYLKRKEVPYLVKYFTYFNGEGGYRDFSVKDMIGKSVMFEYERFDRPIVQNFRIYFIPKHNRGWFKVKEVHNVVRQPYIEKKYVLYYNGKEWKAKTTYYNREDDD